MTINQLITVITLIDNSFNVSITAQKLHKVQSAISNQIRALEGEFGEPLFERKGKRLIGLTPLCEKLLPHIKRLLNTEGNIKLIASDHFRSDRGELRIATTHTQARYFLPGIIEKFRKKYPEVCLSFNLDNPSNFTHMLRERQVDIAIFAEDDLADSSFVGVKCYRWNRVLAVEKGHELEGKKITLRAIAKYPIATYMQGYADRSLIDRKFKKAGLDINVTCGAGDADIILTYARLNKAVGIVSQMVGSKESKDFVFYDLSDLFSYSTTRAVYDGSREQREYMIYFTDLLREHGKAFEQQLS